MRESPSISVSVSKLLAKCTKIIKFQLNHLSPSQMSISKNLHFIQNCWTKTIQYFFKVKPANNINKNNCIHKIADQQSRNTITAGYCRNQNMQSNKWISSNCFSQFTSLWTIFLLFSEYLGSKSVFLFEYVMDPALGLHTYDFKR